MNDEKFPILKSKDVFCLPVGDYFDAKSDACMLVYSPKANTFFLATPKEVNHIELMLKIGETNKVIDDLLRQSSCEEQILSEIEYSKATTLFLLLNERCNFHCQYCYSAGGRSNQELSMAEIQPLVDFLLSSHREDKQTCTIMFVGGGEPTLSWSVVEATTAYVETRAKEFGIRVNFRLSTNGAILNEKMIEFYKKHKFSLQLSFEVLPDVQNFQRGQWSVVDAHLKKLIEEKIPCNVRSTVTKENVDRISETVEFLHDNYYGIQTLSCEPVVDAEYFTTVERVDEYFIKYIKSFSKAYELARKYNIQLQSSIGDSVWKIRERFCGNLICLTPYGTLTTCPNISAPQEADYEASVFAKVDVTKGEVLFDDAAYKRLKHNTIHNIPECQECWARWNCGSGCPNQRRVYSKDIFLTICKYTKIMLIESLLRELFFKYQKKTGRDLRPVIISKLRKMQEI